MSDIETRAATWSQPITPDAPCGTSSRYEEDYDTMMAEIAKLESVHSTPDWALIYDHASSLLKHKTKDMAVLGGLCVALLKQEGFSGLAAGLGAYRALFEAHGPKMFPWPNRKRGRASAYGWMIQHLTAEISRREPTSDEGGAIGLCLDSFNRLDELLRPELDDLHPRVSVLRDALSEKLEQAGGAPLDAGMEAGGDALEARPTAEQELPPDLAHEAMAPPAASVSPAASPPTIAVEPFPPSSIRSEEQAREVVRKAAAAIKMAAAFFERRAEELTQDKERIEEQIRQAENIVQLQRHADDLLEAHGRSDEPSGEGGGEGDGGLI
jgi:type VI secretion system ImpA/VasJ family protein